MEGSICRCRKCGNEFLTSTGHRAEHVCRGCVRDSGGGGSELDREGRKRRRRRAGVKHRERQEALRAARGGLEGIHTPGPSNATPTPLHDPL